MTSSANPSDARVVARCRVLSLLACGTAILIACLVFIGWTFNLEALKRIVPGLVSMNPLTAACFILCGGALWALLGTPWRPFPVLARILAFFAALIALLKLADLILGLEFQLDQWMFRSKLDIDAVRKNRMSPTTALNFFLLGLALLLVNAETRRGRRPTEWLALLVSLFAMLALIGYCYGVRSLTGLAEYIPMALHTAFCFVVLAGGLMCAVPEHGLMSRFTRDSDGGAMLRRLLPIIMGAPLVLGWIILLGQRTESYDAQFAFSLFVIAVVLVFSVLVWWNAVSLDRKEAERQCASTELQKAHNELEQRVQERTGELSQVLAEITRGITVLGTSAEEIVKSTGQLAGAASDSSSALAETTTTIEEVRQTAHVASDKAQSVAESARTVAEISAAGKEATEDMLAGTKDIRRQMDSIARGMAHLSEQSQTIGEIIAAVDDLAQQSNLLAVNAAIEAAKSGEQGKGFAVVAQEVKSLAEQSRSATAQVRTILGDIQKATASAALSTEAGSKAVEAGVRRTEQASQSIAAMAEKVTDAARAAAQIAVSSREQLTGLDQVVEAMQYIKSASAQNLESATQLEVAAKRLDALGQGLRELADLHQSDCSAVLCEDK